MNCIQVFFPSFEEGCRADQVMSRYLKVGAAGEVKRPCNKVSDLPRCALIKVARHLFIGRNVPSSKEGKTGRFLFIHTFIDRAYRRKPKTNSSNASMSRPN